jgi:hypothetical protein
MKRTHFDILQHASLVEEEYNQHDEDILEHNQKLLLNKVLVI